MATLDGAPHGLGETAGTYAAKASIDQFTTDMQWLGDLFHRHPELRAVSATVSKGHIDIVAVAEPGVLRNWVRALDPEVHEKGMYRIHSGLAPEDVLKTGHATVHVRRPVDGPGVVS